MYGGLEDAICLLALIIKRPPDLEGLILPYKGLYSPNGGLQRTPNMDLEEGPETGAEALQTEIDVGVDGVEELEDLQIIDTDRDEQQYLAELQNKILDRLAETLARFKSDPKARNSFDAKHVSSAMMVVYRKDERVKILCSKNEGLDREDRTFLRDWKDCMETIARRGDVHQRTAFAVILRSCQELHRKKTRQTCLT
jgi:hypothetical protein